MSYLDFERLDKIDPLSFRTREPYPWINPGGLLTNEGYRRLRESLPDVSQLQPVFRRQRLHGQKSHDRYALEYSDELDIDEPWKEFALELRSKEYRAFVRRMFGVNSFVMNFHWHYAPNGCSISPHCDARRKLGSHIFYFNPSEEWDPTWGGETVLLDDRGRFDPNSNPDFDDFDSTRTADCSDNRSLIFLRRGNSWHGVRRLTCPEGRYRRVFIVVFERPAWLARLRPRIAAPG